MIDFSKVYLKFAKEYFALCNVNLKIEDSERVCLLGEKDSGKTSILRVVAGLEKEYTGDVFINNKNQKELDYRYDISVGYVPFKGVFFEQKTVMQNMMYALSLRNKGLTPYESEELVRNVLTKFDLIDFVDVKVKRLKNKQRYLLAFARLSLRKLDILLVDNIWNNTENVEDVKKALLFLADKNKCTVVIASEGEDAIKDLDFKVVRMHAGIID